MKKSLLALAAVLVVAATMVQVNAQSKPEKGVIVGTLVELTSYAMLEEENLDAAKERAKEGFPIGIIEEETNTLWLLAFRSSAPASHLEVANEHVDGLIGKQVVIQGLKYNKNGINVVRFSTISEY
jgi:hypothetical protein